MSYTHLEEDSLLWEGSQVEEDNQTVGDSLPEEGSHLEEDILLEEDSQLGLRNIHLEHRAGGTDQVIRVSMQVIMCPCGHRVPCNRPDPPLL